MRYLERKQVDSVEVKTADRYTAGIHFNVYIDICTKYKLQCCSFAIHDDGQSIKTSDIELDLDSKDIGACRTEEFKKSEENFIVILKHSLAAEDTSVDANGDKWSDEWIRIFFSNKQAFECTNNDTPSPNGIDDEVTDAPENESRQALSCTRIPDSAGKHHCATAQLCWDLILCSNVDMEQIYIF